MSQRSPYRRVAALAGLLALMTVLASLGAAVPGKTRPHSLAGDLGPMPVAFVAAGGQADAGARFLVQGARKTISFSRNGLAFTLDGLRPAPSLLSSEPCVVNLDFFGAREDAIPEGLEGTGKVFSRLMYRDLWPGIDLVFKGGTNRLTYAFIVRPGADPSRIKLVYRGAEAISLTEGGSLAIKTAAGDFEEDVPVGHQETGSLRSGVAVTFSLEGPAIAVGFVIGAYDRTQTLVLDTAGGYFGRKTGTTSIEVTGGHAGGSQFTLPTGQWIARIGVLGYMKNSPADGMLAIYRNTGTPDIKEHVCHTVAGPLPVGEANKAWTVLEIADGPVWLEPGDYWILRNDSGNFANKFIITGEDMGTSSWGWCYMDYPNWPANTQYLSWVENFSNVEGCFYAEWDVVSPVPVLTSLVPETASAGDPGFLLSVLGSDFVEGAVAIWDGSDRPTTFVSSSELSAKIDAADIAGVAVVPVTVRNPGGKISGGLNFTVSSPAAPSVTSISPPGFTAGGPALTLVVTGTSFVAGSVVRWDGTDRPTTFVSSTEIHAAIDAADVAVGKSVQVSVQNPLGGISNAVEFTINNPSPVVSSLYPGKATAGGTDLVLTISGLNFVPNSVARWNGNDRATTSISGTELQMALTAGDLAAAGEAQVAVFNPPPAGGLSPSMVFAVNNPRPVLASLSPGKAPAGSSGFDLVLTGSSFVPGATVLWGGIGKTTAWASGTELWTSVKASDIATGGEVQVAVSNPAPAEGMSNALVFSVSTFAIGSSPTTSTVTPGQRASYEIQVTPQFGPFDATVSLVCKALPDQCTASFSPDIVTPGATGAVSTLTLSTKAGSSGAGMSLTGIVGPGLSLTGLAALITGLLLAGPGPHGRRRRGVGRLLAACVLFTVVLFAGSCGVVGPADSGTPKGTYRVTVEGTSGTMTLSTVITLVVK